MRFVLNAGGIVVTEADLQTVEELCRLAVAARRLGCRLHLAEAEANVVLRSLIELAGVDDVLAPCPEPERRILPDLGQGDLR